MNKYYKNLFCLILKVPSYNIQSGENCINLNLPSKICANTIRLKTLRHTRKITYLRNLKFAYNNSF